MKKLNVLYVMKKFQRTKKKPKSDLSLKEIQKFYLSSSDNIMIDQLSKYFKCDFVYLNLGKI